MAKSREEARIPYKVLDQFTRDVLIRLGVPEEDAQTTTAVLSQANVRGVETHGSDLLPIYVDRLRNDVISPRPKVRVVKETPAAALVDGDRGLGPVASVYGMKEAMKKAKQAGIGWVNVINSNHHGALAFYSLLAAGEDMLGITTTTTSKIMSPWGSREPIAPNTPIAFAAPTRGYRPVVLDMATSVFAYGRVRLSQERNVPLPEAMVLDEEGNVTLDPFKAVSALSFGGYKGSGLMMMLTILTALLGGAPFAANRALRVGQGAGFAAQVAHLFVAVDIQGFIDVEQFKTSLDEVIATWKGSARRPGFDQVYYPGEIEWNRVPDREEHGIPLNDSLLRELKRIGEELGVPFPAAA